MVGKFQHKWKKHILSIVLIVLHSLGTVFTAYANTSTSEALSRMQRLKEQNKVPAYVLEKGKYTYTKDIRIAHVQGKNVFMRSQPLRKARIITKLTHVNLEYLGEWTHPNNGERWVCVQRKGEIGWIYGQYIDLLKEGTTTVTTNSKTTNNSKKNTANNCDGMFIIFTILYLFFYFANENNKNKLQSSGEDTTQYFSLDGSETKEECCRYYQRDYCGGCSELDSSNRPFSNVLYAKCNYFGMYVHTSRSPQYNSENLESFENECCPYYNKYNCGVCPYMDSTKPSVSYDGYYKCRHFNAYVQADETPQYNPENLKYR